MIPANAGFFYSSTLAGLTPFPRALLSLLGFSICEVHVQGLSVSTA